MGKHIVSMIVVALCLASLTSGCKNCWIYADYTPYSHAAGSGTSYKTDYQKNYKIGEKQTVFIGEDIIKVKKLNLSAKTIIEHKNYYTFQKDFSVLEEKYDVQSKIYANYKYESSGIIKFDIETQATNKGETFHLMRLSNNPENSNWEWAILISDDGRVFKKGLYNYNWKMIYLTDSLVINPETSGNFHPTTSKIETDSTPLMSFEIIYAGMNDVSLNATYREYTKDDLIRPAFSQNLTYKPNAKQIRFKDFVIQIHDVSDERITYTVLEDGIRD
jgi:hypothetical protein